MSNTYIGQQNNTALNSNGAVHPLPMEEQIRWAATHRIIVRFGDIPATTATATAVTLNCMPVYPQQSFTAIRAKIAVPFAIAGNAAYASTQISFGDLESNTQYLAATEANLNAPPTHLIAQGTGEGSFKAYTGAVASPPVATDAITVTFAAPGAGITLASLTQGEIHLYVRLNDGNTPGLNAQ